MKHSELFNGMQWTYEHILESQFWHDLPEKIEKAELQQALCDARDADRAFLKSHGYWTLDPDNPDAKDVFCDRYIAEEEEE